MTEQEKRIWPPRVIAWRIAGTIKYVQKSPAYHAGEGAIEYLSKAESDYLISQARAEERAKAKEAQAQSGWGDYL